LEFNALALGDLAKAKALDSSRHQTSVTLVKTIEKNVTIEISIITYSVSEFIVLQYF